MPPILSFNCNRILSSLAGRLINIRTTARPLSCYSLGASASPHPTHNGAGNILVPVGINSVVIQVQGRSYISTDRGGGAGGDQNKANAKQDPRRRAVDEQEQQFSHHERLTKPTVHLKITRERWRKEREARRAQTLHGFYDDDEDYIASFANDADKEKKRRKFEIRALSTSTIVFLHKRYLSVPRRKFAGTNPSLSSVILDTTFHLEEFDDGGRFVFDSP